MLVFVYGVRPPVGAWMASHPPGGSLTKFDRQAWLTGESGKTLTSRQTLAVDVITTCVDGKSRLLSRTRPREGALMLVPPPCRFSPLPCFPGRLLSFQSSGPVQ